MKDPITIFIGAGVSLDQGFPGWANLASSLLERELALFPELDEDVLSELTSFLVDDLGETTIASIIEALYVKRVGAAQARSELIRDLQSEIYDHPPMVVRSQSLAERTLLLAHALKVAGRDVHIITTNYDDLLEVTAKSYRVRSRFREWKIDLVPYASERPKGVGANEIPISHIHGSIPRRGSHRPHAEPVFSEMDYFRWEETSNFKGYLATRFASGAHLMIGSSMRDWNILQRLYDSSEAPVDRYAIQPIAGDKLLRGEGEYQRFGVDLAPLLEHRGALLGVEVLRPNFFGQVYQFLDEVRAAVSLGVEGSSGQYVPYMDRLARWAESWHRSHYADEAQRRKATERASELATKIQLGLDGCEHAKIEVWVRPENVHERTLELWASSQSMWLSHSTYWPKQQQISNISRGAAVNSFAAGSVFRGRVTPVQEDRWTHYIATPVLVGIGHTPVPVGVVTMLMHAPTFSAQDTVPSAEANLSSISKQLMRMGRDALKA